VFAALAEFERDLIRNAPILGWPRPAPAAAMVAAIATTLGSQPRLDLPAT
jgi:hypothetical protein